MLFLLKKLAVYGFIDLAVFFQIVRSYCACFRRKRELKYSAVPLLSRDEKPFFSLCSALTQNDLRTGALSTFRKHLLRLRLCLTEFFHPVGALLK